MIEYFKSDIGYLVSMFVVFVSGIGVGAGITDLLWSWKNEKDDQA